MLYHVFHYISCYITEIGLLLGQCNMSGSNTVVVHVLFLDSDEYCRFIFAIHIHYTVRCGGLLYIVFIVIAQVRILLQGTSPHG